MKKIIAKLNHIIVLSALGLMAFPGNVLAQVQRGAGPVPVPSNPAFGFFSPAGRETASGLIISIIDILLLVIGLLAVLFLIIGGFRYVTAEGSEERVESAKTTIRNAIIGIVIVILSFVIVRVIANALIYSVA